MHSSCRKSRLWISLALLALLVGALAAMAKEKEKHAAAMDEQKRALHVLNRLAFGPRPGDVQRVAAMGVDKWIDQQLHPDKIDEGALEARLAPLRTLRMSTREMVTNFPSPELIRQIERGHGSIPSDPAEHAIYEAQLERVKQREARLQQNGENNNGGGNAPANAASGNNLMEDESAPTLRRKQAADADTGDGNGNAMADANAGMDDPAAIERRNQRRQANQLAENLFDLAPDQRLKKILKMTPEEQQTLTRGLSPADRDELMDGMNPQQRETMLALNNPQRVISDELAHGKLLREVYSQRQLQEVMTDFWFNHFNVYENKGADRFETTSYERDVIRPHALGKFEDLLVATAKSPAMLFYLDNWLSVGPNADAATNGLRPHRQRFGGKGQGQNQQPRRRGLNENYGRELMELHTLGVNGGYTQKDVTEVARVFTGWTIKDARQGGGYYFESRMHDPGDKIVLDHKIKPGGEKEGLEVLHLLAHQPATAKFISTKLAVRFVSDNPPPALIDKMSKTFLKSDGSIPAVLKTMFDSPEFWSPEAYRAKVKTPLEFVVSALRASDADISDAAPIVRALRQMGMPLFEAQPPTGYSTKSDAWVNSSALLARMNFALQMAGGKMKGVAVDPAGRVGKDAAVDAQQTQAVLENNLLQGDVSKQTHEVIASQLNDPKIARRTLDDPERPPDVGAIAGLILGSPEFQRR